MEFDAIDWMEVSGKKVAIIRTIHPYNPTLLMNYEIKIDGKKFKVVGVQRYAQITDAIEEFGLTVDPI